MTTKKAVGQSPLERHFLRLIARGVLTVREAAIPLDRHRTNIYLACKREGINPRAARESFVRRCIERASRTPESVGRAAAQKTAAELNNDFARSIQIAKLIEEARDGRSWRPQTATAEVPQHQRQQSRGRP
jgi:hypothetical protein